MSSRNENPRFACVVLLELFPTWLALDRPTRRRKGEALREVLERHAGRVSFEWFDADALGGAHTDWALCRFDDLEHFHALWEELRDTEMFTTPYARIVQTHLGIADGWERYEASA